MKGLDDDAPRMFKPQSLKEERHSADVLEISNLDLLMFLASRAKSIAIASTAIPWPRPPWPSTAGLSCVSPSARARLRLILLVLESHFYARPLPPFRRFSALLL